MSLKPLRIGEMIRVSEPWVTGGDAAQQVIAETPTLAGVLPVLLKAHQGLYLPPPADGREEAKLKEAAAALNREHDTCVRLLVALLAMAAQLVAPDRARALLIVRDTLLPDGLRHTQRTYRDEAGHAERAAGQLTPEQWQLLGSVPFAETTLKALVERWVDAATRLGDVVRERARLQEPELEAPTRRRAAKSQWIRAVRALLTMAELSELSEADDHLLFSELRDAEARARQRGRHRPSDQEPTPDEALSAEANPSTVTGARASPNNPGNTEADSSSVTNALAGPDEPRDAEADSSSASTLANRNASRDTGDDSS